MLFKKSVPVSFLVISMLACTSVLANQSTNRYYRTNFSSIYPRLAVAEIAVPSLPDIAAVQMLPNNAHVVLFNPALCRKAGPVLCRFYRYHEYGHLVLKHTQRHDLTRQEKEAQADRWAAQHAPLASVIAAYQYFSNGQGGSPLHGSGQSRATRLMARLGNPL